MKKILTLICSWLVCLGSINNLFAQQPAANDPSFNSSDSGFGFGGGANGIVYNGMVATVALQPNGKIIIGGYFTDYNKVPRNRIARLNEDGTLDTINFNPGDGANNYVLASALQSDGKIIIGGGFNKYDGTQRLGIARLNPDGSLDIGFNASIDVSLGNVYSIKVQPDGKILIGGSFTSCNGMLSGRIARLNADGTFDASFNPGGTGFSNGSICHVSSIDLQPDGKIVVGGDFTSFNGVTRISIVRLNANGTLDTTFDPGSRASGFVNKVAIQTDGKIIMGGHFWANTNLERLNSNGTTDVSFTPFNTGAISSVAIQTDGKIIISGGFSLLTRRRIARINIDGTLDNTFVPFAGFDGSVAALVLQPDGKIITAGSFDYYDGTARDCIARLNPNSTLDMSFNPGTGANGDVNALALQPDGKILFGGGFTTFNGTIRHRIGRLNTDGSLDNTFDGAFGVNSNDVNTIALQPDGKILIGGAFNYYNLIAQPQITRLNSDGSLDTTFNFFTAIGTGMDIHSIALQPDGKIVIGGMKGINRLNPNGSLDTSFNPSVGNSTNVTTIKIQPDGKILLAGHFIRINGTNRSGLARLNADGSLDMSFNPGTGANSPISTIALQADGKIIIGGSFTDYNGITRKNIARLNADGSLDPSLNSGTATDGLVSTVVILPNGKILVGGNFTTYNNIPSKCIVRLNSDGTLDTSFNSSIGANHTVKTIAIQSNNKIIIGGTFTSYNGLGRNRIARLESNGNLDQNFNSSSGTNGNILKVAVRPTGKIIIGGAFTSYNSTGKNRIAGLTANGSVDTDFNPGTGADSTISALAIQTNGKIVIGGYFTSYNGKTRNRIARLNADGSLDTISFNPGLGANSYVLAIAIQPDGKIIIGGNFTSFNGIQRSRIARLNADGTLDTSFDPGTGTDSIITTIAIQSDGKIIVGGNFTSLNGTNRNRIARLNPDGTIDTSFNSGTGTNSGIAILELQPDGKIVIGGNFTNYNGTLRNNIARLNTDGSLDNIFNPGSGANNSILSIAFQTNGKIIIGGEFTSYNGTIRNRFARLNANGSLDTSFDPVTGANGSISALAIQNDGKIIIGGSFTSYHGFSRNKIARAYGGDYFINTASLTGTSLCAGSPLDVHFTTSGLFNAGNTFTVQLSDANGSFSNPIVIGTLNGMATNPIAATIPASQTPGSNYRLRVVSSNPVIIGSDNGSNLTINGPISATVTGPASVCHNTTGAFITFTGTGSPGPFTFTYNISRGPDQMVTTTSGNSVTVAIPTGTPGNYYYNLENVSVVGGCSKSLGNTVMVIVNSNIVTSGTQTNVTTSGGSNGSATVTVSGGTAPYTYSWNTSPVQTTATASGLTAGTYQVTVTDAANCTQTHSFTILPAPSNNADLSNLVLPNVVLTPTFSAATIYYSASVNNNFSSVTVTPTKADPNAAIKVNGVSVASGTTSSPIPLNVGANTIITEVTAQDGTTTKAYTVVINRAIATSINEESSSAGIVLYPNPSSGKVYIEIPTAEAELTLKDLTGKFVMQKTLKSPSRNIKEAIEVKASQGTYLLKITTKERVFTKKLILQ